MKQIFIISQEHLDQLVEKALERFDSKKSKETRETSFDDPIDIEALSQFLGKSKPAIYGMVHRKQIPFHKTGRKLYFFKSEILDWVKSTPPTSDPEKELDDFLSQKRKGGKKS